MLIPFKNRIANKINRKKAVKNVNVKIWKVHSIAS